MTPAPDSQKGQVAEAEQALFGDTLVATESLPVRLVVGSELDSAHLQARAEWLLRTLGQIESGAIDHDEEHPDPALRRVEAKLDLTLDLLSSVLQTSRPLPEEMRLRWSHLGVSFVSSGICPRTQAVLHLYLRPWLPTPLALPVRVTFEKTTYAGLPEKFEAGTPAIASQIGLGAAIDYLNSIDLDAAFMHEHALLEYATEKLSGIEGVRIIGTSREKASVLSFTVENVHPHDIGTILDQQGIAVRAGHHCAQPVMQHFQVPATARASFAFYNTRDEVDALAAAIEKVIEVFA